MNDTRATIEIQIEKLDTQIQKYQHCLTQAKLRNVNKVNKDCDDITELQRSLEKLEEKRHELNQELQAQFV